MKISRGLVFRIFCLAFLSLYLSPACSFAEPPLRIGFIGALSGSAAAFGTAAKNGTELALEETGASGRLAVIYEDDQHSPAKSVAAFHKLKESGVDLVITIGSTPSNAVAPLAQSAELPLVAWASDARVSKGRSFVIRSYPSGYAEGVAAAAEITKLGGKRVAVVVSMNDYITSWIEGLRGELGSRVVSFQEITGEQSDFRANIMRTFKDHPDQFVICVDISKNGLIARQLRQLGRTEQITGCEYLRDSGEVASAQGALRGAKYPSIVIDGAFTDKYASRFGNVDGLSAAANYYDLIKVLVRLQGTERKAELIQALLALGAQSGAVGTFSIVERNGDRFFDIPLIINTVE